MDIGRMLTESTWDITIDWTGTAVVGDTSPARYARRHKGLIYLIAPPVSPPEHPASPPSAPAAPPLRGDPIGEFSVVVVNGLAAFFAKVPLKDVCAAAAMPDLSNLEVDGSWIPRIEERLLPDTDWINNLIYLERLVGYPGRRASDFEARTATELLSAFGIGCSLACFTRSTFDLGPTWTDHERHDFGSTAIHLMQLAGWKEMRSLNVWIFSVMES